MFNVILKCTSPVFRHVPLLIGLWFCIAEPTSAIAMDPQPDTVFSFTAEELKSAQEISPEELMRQIAENAAEIEKLENEGKCSEPSNYDYRKAPQQKWTRQPRKCKKCQKILSGKNELKRHMRIHTGKKPFKCAECGKAFNQSAHLRTHQTVHTKERRFGCSNCGKTFTQKGHMKDHERIHARDKAFPCPTCGKAYTRQSSLQRHERTHTDEKPYGPDAGPETESKMETGHEKEKL